MKKQKNYHDGPVTVYLRITVAGQRAELATGRTCLPDDWNPQAGRAMGSKQETKAFNAHLNDLQQKVYEAYRQLTDAGLSATADAIKNRFMGKAERPKMLVEIFQDHNDKLASLIGRGYSKGTWTCFQTSLKHTKEFLLSKYKVTDIEVKRIDHVFITEYHHFLRADKKCQNNSAVKNMKNFGKIVRYCLASGWLASDPFLHYKHTMKRVDRVFLSADELQEIINKQFDVKRLSQVRDVFVFCCLTGLAFADVKRLRKENLVKGIDGDLWIEINRLKTNTKSKVPLLPTAQKLIDYYSQEPHFEATGYLLPVLSNQKMNSYLKEITDGCSIDKKVTSHIARHTFATTVTLQNGVPIESVSKMLGHTNLRITQHYAKILDIKVSEDMAALKQKFA